MKKRNNEPINQLYDQLNKNSNTVIDSVNGLSNKFSNEISKIEGNINNQNFQGNPKKNCEDRLSSSKGLSKKLL